MVRKLSNPWMLHAARRGPMHQRTSLVTVLTLVTLGLAACGDPDDDDGGGVGYVAAPLIVQAPV
ncbi:hypothetical protein [Blastococcus saxobsidens]|uniref:Uncharacterized protein n=1 Tax=Blastococcus saxobsidens (strain DD2) TaxID=1146883 RepID=H6RK35_BLASD|nr:hypothetical protein [Blastococcus saxobsidens]CCG04891.1 exported protein of unknown function [Blastococcus saxobsidens DD2]